MAKNDENNTVGRFDMSSKFMRVLLIIVTVFLIFAGPTYVSYLLSNILNVNYVAPMIMLAEHYKTSGEDAVAQAWKKWALEIAKKADNKKICEDIEKKGL